jgi:hypothetical protein
MEQLMKFNKILDDFENIKVHLEDEDEAILCCVLYQDHFIPSIIPCSMVKKASSPW